MQYDGLVRRHAQCDTASGLRLVAVQCQCQATSIEGAGLRLTSEWYGYSGCSALDAEDGGMGTAPLSAGQVDV